MYIPYHCGTVVDWTLTMICIINKLIESSTIFQLATLWIPSTYMASPILDKYSKRFLQLATGWTYQTTSCNSATYGDWMSAHRVYFQISRPSDKALMANTAPDISLSSSYGLHIDSKKNEDLTCTSFPLTTNVSIACNISNNHTIMSSLPIAMIPSMDISLDSGIILDLDYPAMEPTSDGSCKFF